MFDVACIGILVADAVTRTVQDLPDTGKLAVVEHIDLFTGGCAASSCINMSRLGLKTAISGKIGTDGFGRFMRQALELEGIYTGSLSEDSQVGTSASVVLVDKNGERSFLHSFGANAVFTDSDVSEELLENSRIVFVAGTMLMPAFDGEPCARVLKRAKALGKITALDTAWDSTGKWMKVLEPCLPFLDYFLPSYDEAVELSGEKDPEAIADFFLLKGVGVAVIKLGKDGCLMKTKDEMHRVGCIDIDQVLDTTGAGDAFVSGFLTGLSLGLSLYECGRMANAVGALCVSAVGASTGIHSMEQVKSLLSLSGTSDFGKK